MSTQVKIKKVPVEKYLSKYQKQTNVIKKTRTTLNYGSIVIMTDMDPDGNDIQCLLMQFFSKWPDLFLQGRIKRLRTPLFVCRHKKKPTRYFYTFDEFEANKSNLAGYEIDYIKGLGSLSPEDYKETVITNPNELTITLDDEYLKTLGITFGYDSELRKQWLLHTNEGA